MSTVRIRNAGDMNNGALVGYGTVVELDGKEVRQVRSIEVSPITIDDVISVKLEVLASDVDVEFPADVSVRVVHISECPQCVESMKRAARTSAPRLVSLRAWTPMYDVTHMQSRGKHRERVAGTQRFASIEIRVPVVIVDWAMRLSAWLHRSREVAA